MKLQQGAISIDQSLIDIDIEFRQRREGRKEGKLETEDLEKSIRLRGLLNPIIVEPTGEGRFRLIAGERRLTACRNLGLPKVLVRKATDLTPQESQIIELEENIKRVDLDWQDICRSVAKVHQLYVELDSGWTMAETAAECAISQPTVSLYISVFNEMNEERIRNAGSVREAYNMINRRDQRRAGAALEDLLETPEVPSLPAQPVVQLSLEESKEVEALRDLGKPLPKRLEQKLAQVTRPAPPAPAPESILNLSFLDWVQTYSGPKFNFVHCDFPYGVDLFSGPQGRGAELGQDGKLGYADSADVYQTLLEAFCQNLNKFMSNSAHLMFWLSADYRIISETVSTFARLAPSLKFHKFPLIWLKSDNAGIAADVRHGPRHVYEACLMASRGSRNIAKVKGDCYSAPTDKKLHPSTKPEPMLRHFMEMFVDETTIMLDPTCGSAASLRAAESLGAKHVLGLEIDRQFCEPARLALKQARMKRAAEKGAGV